MRLARLLAWALSPLGLVAFACGDDGTSPGSGGSGASATSAGPTTAGPSTGSGSTTGGSTTGATAGATGSTTTGSGSTTSSGTGGGMPTDVLRFVALGDAGEGNPTQYKVADAMKAVCEAKGGCDFALYLGDNFYDDGVSGPSDGQFQTKFEQPYAMLPFKFYVVLGNHDYGGDGVGNEFNKGQYYVNYAMTSTKFTIPSPYYSFKTPQDVGPPNGPSVEFFGLDTNMIFWGQNDGQQSWLDGATAASTATWKIAFGHHPYISNGQHGNAGEYEGIPGIPIISGQNVKDFFDDSICGDVDIYICGHDHNRQWLQPACGVEFIVSGTGAKTTDLVGQGTQTFYENDQKGGFLLVEMTGTTFTGTFYDEDQLVEYTRTVTQ